MANFTYNVSILDRAYPEWESWLDKITDAEAERIADPVGLVAGGEVPTQGAYNALMEATQNYYKKMR